MQIRILKPGMLSTLQDMGRVGYLSQAVPVSGAMDTLSARIANKAVGNEDGEAVIEFTYANAVFKAETDILMAYAGKGAIFKTGEQELPAERPLFIPAGTVIDLINDNTGSRIYLAIAGGWEVPLVLGSRSTYLTATLGGLNGRALKAGDLLNNTGNLTKVAKNMLSKLKGSIINYNEISIPRQLLLTPANQMIRVVPAREFTWFDANSITDFLSTGYTLSRRSNRMGYHLEGAMINRIKKDELFSTAVTPGTIQVTGNGSMILLMADGQTTGGYPRIARVAAVDLPICAQLKPGDTIFFKEISRQAAEILYLEREQQLRKLTMAISSRFMQ
jgi:antagonist of KipI